MDWNVENPMVIDPAPKLIGLRYEDGNWDDTPPQEEFYFVNIDIDTRKLDAEKESELYCKLDDISCYKCGYNFDGDYFGYLKAEYVDVEGFGYEKCGICGKIAVKGRVAESVFIIISELLDGYNIEVIEK